MHSKRMIASFLFLVASISCVGFANIGRAQEASDKAPGDKALIVRITQPVDDAKLVILKGNTHPLALARFDRGASSPSAPTGRLILMLQRSASQEQSLQDYLASLQDPSSPHYHQWLTPASFGTTYGIGDADMKTVAQWLQAHGFKIDKIPESRNRVEFSGTLGQVEQAFHTSIHSFEVNGEHHYANVSDPKIPSAFAQVVKGISQLHDFHPKPQSNSSGTARYNASTRKIEPEFTLFNGTTPYLYVDPADAATIYDTPNPKLNPNYSGTLYDGTGVNLGIVGDSNVTLADITNYRLAFLGETATTANVPTVVVDGNDPGVNGDEPEGLLDNEIAGGLAPKAKIYFYTSSNTDLQSGLFDAIFRAVDDNVVSILNISFGVCEANLGSAGNAAVFEANEQAAAQGISVVVSSGDSGSAACDSSGSPAAQNGLAVNALASTPFNIAAGGTDFDVLASSFSTYVEDSNSGTAPYYRTAQKYIPENPWNDSTTVNTTLANNVALTINGVTNVIATGGGASALYAKPSYQSTLTPKDSARDLPDISLLAANGLYGATWVVCADSATYGPDCLTSGGQFVDGARFSGYGGTSTAAPALSGILALVEQKVGSRLGQANYILYQLASSKYGSVFHDVTTGNNSVYCVGGSTDCNGNNFMSGFDANTGYDQASGLGSVDVAALVKNWSSVALANTQTSFSINGSTAPLTITHGTSVAFKVGVTPSTANGTAAIIDTANETSGAALNDGQLAIAVTSGSGAATYNGLPGGTYNVYARYGGDTTDAASNSTPSISVTVNPESSSTVLTVSAYNLLTGVSVPAGLTAVPYGSETFLDAQIYGTAEGVSGTQGTATGTVSFTDGNTAIGTAPVSVSNTASYPAIDASSYPVFAIGAHNIFAKYSGDPSFNTNTSPAVALNIVKAGTTIVSSASSTSIPSAASTTLTIYVSSASLGTSPTGTLTLAANGSTIATLPAVPQVGGIPANSVIKAVIAGNQLAAGSNTINISYSGDSNYTASTGTIVVSVTPSKFTLTNSGPLTLTAGAQSANTATIKASPINSFVGAVNLICTLTNSPTSATSPAACSLPASLNISGSSAVNSTVTITTTAATTPGAYQFTVTGTDAATDKISSSTALNVTVKTPAANPAFALSNSGNLTIAPGAASGNSATITVTPAGGLTGSISLACAVSTSVSNPNDPPTCSIPLTVSITGSAAVTAFLTVNTTAATTAALGDLPWQPKKRTLFGPAGGAIVTLAAFLAIPLKRKRWKHLGAFLFVILIGSAVGCGGSGSSSKTTPGNAGTTAGTYQVTITGTTTGAATQTTTVTVNVN